MVNINIVINDDLHKALKQSALNEDITLKQKIINKLSEVNLE